MAKAKPKASKAAPTQSPTPSTLPLWRADNKLGFKGVSKNSRGPKANPFSVAVKKHGKTISLGTFPSQKAAAEFYAKHMWDTHKLRAPGETSSSNAPAPPKKSPTLQKKSPPPPKFTPKSSSQKKSPASQQPDASSKKSKLPLWKADNASGYKGVSKAKGNERNPWMVVMKRKGKTMYLGVHPTVTAAAEAYAEIIWKEERLRADGKK
jgi:hypothetical protein